MLRGEIAEVDALAAEAAAALDAAPPSPTPAGGHPDHRRTPSHCLQETNPINN